MFFVHDKFEPFFMNMFFCSYFEISTQEHLLLMYGKKGAAIVDDDRLIPKDMHFQDATDYGKW